MEKIRLMIRSTALSLLLMAIAVPLQVARADLGPKPSMHFEFIYEIDPPPTILSGAQYECTVPDCSDARQLEALGPQNFGCSAGACSSMAYSYSDYHIISIQFSDGKTRQSGVFGKKYFEAYYRVTVQPEALMVEELPGKDQGLSRLAGLVFIWVGLMICGILILYLPLLLILIILLMRGADFRAARGWYIAGWLACALALIPALILSGGLLLTLLVELLLALAYALWRRRSRIPLLTVVLMMNLITQPALWFALHNLVNIDSLVVLIVGEVIVWLVEAGILSIALRRQVKFSEPLMLSLALNLASFGLGLLLPLG